MDDSANKLQYLIDALGITPSAFADNIGEKRPTGVYNVLKGTYRVSP